MSNNVDNEPLNCDNITWMCDTGNHERCFTSNCECFCHNQKPATSEIDNSVLTDAASQFESAARRLRKAAKCLKGGHERKRLIGEARALMHGAEARIK